MAGTFLPLIGYENIARVADVPQVLDASSAAMNLATIDGAQVFGRKGTQKTSLLLALAGASTTAVPLTTSAALAAVRLRCPPGFATPANAGDDGYDYSKLLPEIRAQVVCSGFAPTVNAWPVDMTALITALNAAPANLATVEGRVTGMSAPDEDNPYGTLTISFSGAATTAAVANALLAVTVDFGSSVAN